ncbi:Heterokaryon incompatibility protein 6, OR allele [Fusarium oxysporum f. sp. albedinis]|nr:Heterokaryon incompatibility protein 6, OR allele [Fusarium oxysporum f. sp. albedinis]
MYKYTNGSSKVRPCIEDRHQHERLDLVDFSFELSSSIPTLLQALRHPLRREAICKISNRLSATLSSYCSVFRSIFVASPSTACAGLSVVKIGGSLQLHTALVVKLEMKTE